MEKSTLHQIHVKNKQRKKRLCYFGLVVLCLFLILPPAFRLFIKDKNSGEIVVQDVVTILNCNTANESITSTFLNGKPGTLTYKIRGNYLAREEKSNPDENTDGDNLNNSINGNEQNQNIDSTSNNDLKNEIKEEEQISNNANSSVIIDKNNNLLSIISKYGNLEYNIIEDASIIKIAVVNLEGIPEYEPIFSTLENQQSYYGLQGFSCTSSKLE